ncbi:MAG: hypothetical protein ABI254_14480, partial [Chthoniobacterales bacterium]
LPRNPQTSMTMKAITRKIPIRSLGAAACMLLAAHPLHAAAVASTWSGAISSTWETAGNWTPSTNYPNSGQGGSTYGVTIGDATGNRVITTSTSIVLQALQITQSSTGGSNVLKLGANMSFSGLASAVGGITNSTSDPSKVVIDLNGYNFTFGFNQADFVSAGNYTIRSTGSAGGTFGGLITYNGYTNLHVEDNVTIDLTNTVNTNLSGAGNTFSKASTFIVDYNNSAAGYSFSSNSSGLGNVQIGKSTNAYKTAPRIGTNGG